MSDYTELKRMAEAVKKSYADLCEHGGDQLAEAWNSAELAYDDAANPDVVLTLIAENEALRRNAARYMVLRQADVDTIHSGGLFAGLTPDNIVINGQHLDDRTDAVIAARKRVTP